jgi:LPXTG-motif cell wall-anchored protein
MKSLRTKIAAVAIAVAAVIAAPAAASAYTPSGPTAGITATGTFTPGGSITLTAGGYDLGTQVSFTVTGENGAGITLAMVKFVSSTSPVFGPYSANASGVANSAAIVLPSNASGTYTVTATAPGYTNQTTQFAVGSSAGGGGLPNTGFDATSMLGVWIGGGVLLLGGVLVTVFAARRERQDA